MKRLLMLLFMAVLLTACGNNQDEATDNTANEKETTQNDNQENDTVQEETEDVESKYPFPKNAEPVGDATITLSTAGGTSEGGNVPVLFVQEDILMDQIGMDLANFQGDKQTFIYVEKRFVEAMQVGELTQSSLDVEGDLLKPGTYTVTAVQFENDDPEGKVVNYTEAKFEVKKGAS